MYREKLFHFSLYSFMSVIIISMKKILIIISWLLFLLALIPFFKPVIPLVRNRQGIIYGDPYHATRNNIYYNSPFMMTEHWEIEVDSVIISWATIWNSKMLWSSLITPTAVYTDWWVQLTGADPNTYVDVQFTMSQLRFYSPSISAFWYDKDNLYVGWKTIPLTGNKQPFNAYRNYIKSL